MHARKYPADKAARLYRNPLYAPPGEAIRFLHEVIRVVGITRQPVRKTGEIPSVPYKKDAESFFVHKFLLSQIYLL